MKEKKRIIRDKSIVSKQKTFIKSILTAFIDIQAAGIIGAISAAFQPDHPVKISSVIGGIVSRSACADPTPGPVTHHSQAMVNYSYVSVHPYNGISDSSLPPPIFKYSGAKTSGRGSD